MALLVVLSSPATANEWNQLKSCVKSAGDLNGDRIPDIWIASRDEGSPVVWAVSGHDGSLLHALPDGGVHGFGAELARLGDLDGDGVDDLAVAGRTPHIALRNTHDPRACFVASVFSGRSGCVLFEIPHGWSVAAAGDVDRDGVPDVLSGSSELGCTQSQAFADVRSGRDGSLVLRVTDPASVLRRGVGIDPSYFGASVCGVGDVDDDGVPDFVVGAPGFLLGPDGHAYLYSARRGRVIGGVYGDVLRKRVWDEHFGWREYAPSQVGWELCPVTDVDGDGRDDVLVCAINELVIAVSSRDLGPLVLAYPTDNRHAHAYGSSVDAAGDLNGDGLGDWLVGANEDDRGFDIGYADVRSGRDGSTIRRLYFSREHGVDVANAGDANSDGIDDHVIVMPTMHIARILSGRDGALVREIDLAKLRAQSNDPDVLRTR